MYIVYFILNIKASYANEDERRGGATDKSFDSEPEVPKFEYVLWRRV